MLILKLYNTLEGTNENAVYRYAVFINDVQIVEGEVSGHNRNDGWAELVRGIAQHHLTQRAADGDDCEHELDNSETGLFCIRCGECF